MVLKEKNDCKVFGEHSVLITDLFPEFISQLLRDFKELGIKEQLITKNWRRGKAILGKTSEVRYIADDIPLPEAYVVISGDLVITFDCQEPYYAILIKSKTKAMLHATFFDRLWKIAKR